MSWMPLGSLALPHHLHRQGVGLRNEIARLSQELTTGTVASPARHLKGAIGPLATIDARVTRNEAYAQATAMAATRADAVQNVLTGIEALRQQTADRMLASATAGTTGAALGVDGQAAAGAFADAVSALGLTTGGAAPFSGTASESAPLIAAEDMLAALSPLVTGLDSAEAVAAAISAAFMDPGGLFESSFYTGGDAARGGAIGDARFADALPTAADPALRQTLAALATGAMLADPALGLSGTQRNALARAGAEVLMSAATGMTALQARVGEGQSALDRHATRLATESDGLALARQALIGADPYEAATQLEQAQTQLEMLYTVTARTARLNLAGYLG
jgi:flagellar hook-associated protein 3 FlgL